MTQQEAVQKLLECGFAPVARGDVYANWKSGYLEGQMQGIRDAMRAVGASANLCKLLAEIELQIENSRTVPKELGAVPMLLTCPCCGTRHIDDGEYATKEHHTHLCQKCGTRWRPATIPTVGVRTLSYPDGDTKL